MDFSIGNEIVESQSFVAESTSGMLVSYITGRGTEQVVVTITGSTGLTARMGTYNFNFTTGGFTAVSESIDQAFQAVTVMPETEPPTTATTIVTVTSVVEPTDAPAVE